MDWGGNESGLALPCLLWSFPILTLCCAVSKNHSLKSSKTRPKFHTRQQEHPQHSWMTPRGLRGEKTPQGSRCSPTILLTVIKCLFQHQQSHSRTHRCVSNSTERQTVTHSPLIGRRRRGLPWARAPWLTCGRRYSLSQGCWLRDVPSHR